MTQVTLEITAHGGVAMLHDDAVDLSEMGDIEVTRASHVEFCEGKPLPLPPPLINRWPSERGWFVQSAKTGEVLVSGIKTRAMALAWEKHYYSPGGEGWKELTA